MTDSPDERPEPQAGPADLDLDHQGRPRERSHGGRPTRYTVPVVLALVEALFGGATRSDAARHAGISPATFYAWVRLGREGHPAFAPLALALNNVELRRGQVRSFLSETGKRRFWKAFR